MDIKTVFQNYIANMFRIAPPDYDGPTRTATVCGMCYSEDSFVNTQKYGTTTYLICGVCGSRNLSREI